MKGFVLNAKWSPKPEYYITEEEKAKGIAIRGNMVWKNPSSSLEKELPMPECGSNDVLIKVGACGICGSDVNMYEEGADGYIAFSSQCGFPVIIGHEFSGEIVEVGKKVSRLKIGELVTAEELRWCGLCDNCIKGDFNQCRNFRQMGFDSGNSGAFAEYVSINEKYCYNLKSLEDIFNSKEEIFESGALVEPSAVAYEGIFTVGGGFNPGEHMVIFGAGAIGLASIQLARATGAAKIIVFEPIMIRRELAKKMGADYVYNPFNTDYTPEKLIMELTDGVGVGMAIEASGAPSYCLPEMEKGIAVGGKIVLLGMAAQYPRFDLMLYLRKKVHLYGAFGASGHGNFSKVINLMASGRINMRQCITDRYNLDEVEKALKKARTGNTGKIMIKPRI